MKLDKLPRFPLAKAWLDAVEVGEVDANLGLDMTMVAVKLDRVRRMRRIPSIFA